MNSSNARTVFFGTPQFVTYVLDELESAGLLPSLVVTAPEKPQGRGLLLQPSPVKVWATKRNIEVLEPLKIDGDFISSLTAESGNLKPAFDLFIVAGYGKILPPELLKIPSHGTLNVHPSLLPKFRGPSPIESQILEDSKEVGVSVILLDEETDHGPVVAQKSFVPSDWPMMRRELEDLLWKAGGKLLAESIPPYMEGQLVPKEQDHSLATFTPKLLKSDGLLDLSGDPYKNYLKYCAYERWPGTYFFAERGGKKIQVKITEAEFAEGEFRLLRVTPEGKREMSYQDFLRGQ